MARGARKQSTPVQALRGGGPDLRGGGAGGPEFGEAFSLKKNKLVALARKRSLAGFNLGKFCPKPDERLV